MAALNHVAQLVFHVVAQIVEAELVVRAVSDVGRIGRAALVVVEPMDDDAHREAQKCVDLPHPGGVAPGEIVVHGDHMHAIARQRVEVGRQRRNQGLALARSHFGDRALMEHHAADQLHIEMALPQGALGGLAHCCEGGDEQFVEGAASGDLGAEVLRAGAQRLVAQGGHLRLQCVDGGDLWRVAFQPTIIGRAENPTRERTEHRDILKGGPAPAPGKPRER